MDGYRDRCRGTHISAPPEHRTGNSPISSRWAAVSDPSRATSRRSATPAVDTVTSYWHASYATPVPVVVSSFPAACSRGSGPKTREDGPIGTCGGPRSAGDPAHHGTALSHTPITKPAAVRRGAVLGDYDSACRSFSWAAARRELSGLPGGAGLNIAYEAVDRHADGARADVVALR